MLPRLQDRNSGHLKCAPICPEWQGILFYVGLKINKKVFEQFPFPCEQCGGGGWAQKTVASLVRMSPKAQAFGYLVSIGGTG